MMKEVKYNKDYFWICLFLDYIFTREMICISIESIIHQFLGIYLYCKNETKKYKNVKDRANDSKL